MIANVKHFKCCMVYLQGSRNYSVAYGEALMWEAIVTEVKVNHIREYSCHGLITECIDATNVKVAQETRGHCIPPTTRGTHSRNQLQINQSDFGGVF